MVLLHQTKLPRGSSSYIDKLYDNTELLFPRQARSGGSPIAECGRVLVGISGADPTALVLYRPDANDPDDITVQSVTLSGHSSTVYSVAFSSDGKRIVSGSGDKTIRVWDSGSGECIRALIGHSSSVSSVAFSSDGERIVSGSWDKTVQVWDSESGECIRMLNGHSESVYSVAFSSDGKWVVSGSGDETVRAWDCESGECIRTLSGHSNCVWSVVFSSYGKRIVSGSDDNTVRVWDNESGECIRTLSGHSNWINSVAFSNDGKWIVSGSRDETVRVWDSESGECIRTLRGHSSSVNSVMFSSDGKRIVSGSWDKTVRVWDSESGECIRRLSGHFSPVNSAAFSSDGKRIVSGSWDNTVGVWDSESGECIRMLSGHSSSVYSVVFSNDGERIVSGSGDNTLRLWDSESGECIYTLSGHSNWVLSVAVNNDGKRIVSGSDDKTVRVWDSESIECIRTLSGHSSSVRSVAFDRDGRRIVSGSADMTLRVWDSESGECICMLSGHTSSVCSVAFSNDGKWIVSGSDDKTVRIWDSESGKCIRTLSGHSSSVYGAVFSTDGKRIVSGSADNTVGVWDSESGECIRTLRGHANCVRSVAFSSDGKRIVSGSRDNSVRVWDSESGECIRTLSGHSSSVWSVAFSCDGKRIVSGSGDKTVRVCDTEMSEPSLLSLPSSFSDFALSTTATGRAYARTVVSVDECTRSILLWATASSLTERRLIGLILVENDTSLPSEAEKGNPIFDTLTANDAWSSLRYIVVRRPQRGFDLRSIPNWSTLIALRHFDVSYSPLNALPAELGLLSQLQYIDVRHCGVSVIPSEWSALRTRHPPFPSDGLRIDDSHVSVLPRALQQKVQKDGAMNVLLGYLCDLAKTEIVTRLRMVTAGDAAHGKTFLSRALSNESNRSTEGSTKLPGSTVGVDMFGYFTTLRVIDPRTSKSSSIRYKVDIWDFAGHEEYFPLHSLLFSELVQYLLVLNAKMVDDGRSHMTHLRKWMMSIAARAPSGRVILVLTQSDRLPGWKENRRRRVMIALRIAKEGHRQLMEAHDGDHSGLDVHCDVVVADSRKSRFIVVSGTGLNKAVEMSRSDLCTYLVRSAVQYMSVQSLFQGRSSTAVPDCTDDPIAPVVPALYLNSMDGISKWRKDKKSWRDYASASFAWLLRIFVNKERAAQSRDVMTFQELCGVLKGAGVSSGDEFERVVTVLQSWGVLFYYGTNPGQRYEQNMSQDEDDKAETSHESALAAADTASKLVFVNPRVLVDVTAHLYVRHHYHTLKSTVDDNRRIGSTALSEEAMKRLEKLDTDGLFKKYGIASETLLEKIFEHVRIDHGLSIAGVVDLIEAMQLVHKLEVYFPTDSKDRRSSTTKVPVFIAPSLISERRPKRPFPRAQGSAGGALYDFTLQFNSSGLASLITHWVLQYKRLLESKCTRRGVMWNGGADVYGGEKTMARIEWLRDKRASMDIHGLGSGETAMVRIQGGPLGNVSRKSLQVQQETSGMMCTVFQTLQNLISGAGPCSGIELDCIRIASPCKRKSHIVSLDAQLVFANGGTTGVIIKDCEGCEAEGLAFQECSFRLPFLCATDHSRESTVAGGTVTKVVDDIEDADGRPTQELEQRAVRMVGDTIIPSRSDRQTNLIRKVHSLEGNLRRSLDLGSVKGVGNRVVQRLVNDVDKIKADKSKLEKKVHELTNAMEYFLSELTALRNVVNAECDSDVPRLFILLPEDRKWWRKFTSLDDLFSKPHRLYLLCETGDGPHIPPGHAGYKVREPHEFIKRHGRTISRVLKIVSKGLRLASFVPGTEVARKTFGSLGDYIREALEDEDSCEAIRKALEGACEQISHTATTIDAPSAACEQNGGDIQMGDAVSTRGWRRYVDSVDVDRDRAGLLQTRVEWHATSTQRDGRTHRLWLCPDCYRDLEATHAAQASPVVGRNTDTEIANATLFQRV